MTVMIESHRYINMTNECKKKKKKTSFIFGYNLLFAMESADWDAFVLTVRNFRRKDMIGGTQTSALSKWRWWEPSRRTLVKFRIEACLFATWTGSWGQVQPLENVRWRTGQVISWRKIRISSSLIAWKLSSRIRGSCWKMRWFWWMVVLRRMRISRERSVQFW